MSRGGGFGNTGYLYYEKWEHGWPFTFLRRLTDTPSARHAFWDGQLALRIGSLLCDALLYIVLVAVVMMLVFRKVRVWDRGAGGHSYRLIQLFAIVAIACVLLGDIAGRMAIGRRDEAIGMALQARGHSVNYEFAGPAWLSRLWGCRPSASALWRIDGISFSIDSDDQAVVEALSLGLASLDGLRVLRCDYTLISDDGLGLLLQSRDSWSIEELSFEETSISGSAFRSCRSLPYLKVVSAWRSELNDSGFEALAALPGIERIDADGTFVAPDAVARFLAKSPPNGS